MKTAKQRDSTSGDVSSALIDVSVLFREGGTAIPGTLRHTIAQKGAAMTSQDPWASTAQDDDEQARIQITASFITMMNLGDHGERVRHPVQVIPDETVEAMVRRVFYAIDAKYRTHDTADVIEIQVLPLPDEEPR